MAMRKQARITSKGQVTVPHEIRRLLGVDRSPPHLFRINPLLENSALSANPL